MAEVAPRSPDSDVLMRAEREDRLLLTEDKDFGDLVFRQARPVPGIVLLSGHRRVRLFRDGRNQAVRIPVDFELPGNEAIMRREGERLVIAPVRKRRLIALLASMKPLDERFPDIDDPAPAAPHPTLSPQGTPSRKRAGDPAGGGRGSERPARIGRAR